MSSISFVSGHPVVNGLLTVAPVEARGPGLLLRLEERSVGGGDNGAPLDVELIGFWVSEGLFCAFMGP